VLRIAVSRLGSERLTVVHTSLFLETLEESVQPRHDRHHSSSRLQLLLPWRCLGRAAVDLFVTPLLEQASICITRRQGGGVFVELGRRFDSLAIVDGGWQVGAHGDGTEEQELDEEEVEVDETGPNTEGPKGSSNRWAETTSSRGKRLAEAVHETEIRFRRAIVDQHDDLEVDEGRRRRVVGEVPH
jgi:hypothetical protein